MKKKAIIFTLVLVLAAVLSVPAPGRQEQQIKYYRVDQVSTLQGEIIAIKTEKCYQDNDFVVLYLKEKTSGETYRVEVSPGWFFTMDLMEGSQVEVTGSSSKAGETNLMIAQSITFRGELSQFRDQSGFPLWRGKGKHRQGARQGKGKRNQRGRH
jgi:hypothetical protein